MKRQFTPEHIERLRAAARERVKRDPESVKTMLGRRQTTKAKQRMREVAAQRFEPQRRAAWERACEWARLEGKPEPKWDPMKPIGHRTTGKRARQKTEREKLGI